MNSATCITPACNPATESTATATQTSLSQYLLSPSDGSTGAENVSDSASSLLQAVTEEDVQRLLARSPTEFIVTATDADKTTITTELDNGKQVVTAVGDSAIDMAQSDASGDIQEASLESATLEWNGDALLNLAGLRLHAATDQLVLSPANQITATMSYDSLAVSSNDTCTTEQTGDSWPLQVVCPPSGEMKNENATMAQVVMQTSPVDYSQKLPSPQLVCCDAKVDASTSQALFSELVASLAQSQKKDMESTSDVSDTVSLNGADTSQLLGFFDDSDAHMRAALINDDDQSPMMSTKSVGVKHGDCCRCEILDFDS